MLLKYSYQASVPDCAYCSNKFTDRNSIWVHSANRKPHKTCLGKSQFDGLVMDRNDPNTTLIMQDPDITCRCADCLADLPVESIEEE